MSRPIQMERTFNGREYEYRFTSNKETCDAYAAETKEMGGQARVVPLAIGFAVWTAGPSPRLQGWMPKGYRLPSGKLYRRPKAPRLSK